MNDFAGAVIFGAVAGLTGFGTMKLCEKVSEKYAEELTEAARRTKDGVVEAAKGVGQCAATAAKAAAKGVTDTVFTPKDAITAKEVAHTYETGSMSREDLDELVKGLGLPVKTLKDLSRYRRRVENALVMYETEVEEEEAA